MQGTYLIYPEKDVFGISRKIRLLMNRSMWLFCQNHQRGIIYDLELFIWCSIYMSYQIFQDMWVPRYLKCLVKLPQPYWTLILQVSYALLYFLSFPLTLIFQLTRLFWGEGQRYWLVHQDRQSSQIWGRVCVQSWSFFNFPQ